mmetsp:Transcript_18940/g.45519  ORF Transcript_18940/g.45519 Transcript_18940/m.45519 type:complete len:207 (+) Transcript_18940:66-686(+)
MRHCGLRFIYPTQARSFRETQRPLQAIMLRDASAGLGRRERLVPALVEHVHVELARRNVAAGVGHALLERLQLAPARGPLSGCRISCRCRGRCAAVHMLDLAGTHDRVNGAVGDRRSSSKGHALHNCSSEAREHSAAATAASRRCLRRRRRHRWRRRAHGSRAVGRSGSRARGNGRGAGLGRLGDRGSCRLGDRAGDAGSSRGRHC